MIMPTTVGLEKKTHTLLIHGPLDGNCYAKLINALSRHPQLSALDKIVVSSYAASERAVRECFSNYSLPVPLEFVFSPDVVNPGFYNINRQVHLVNAGLARIADDGVVIKLRNDQCVDFAKLVKLLNKFDFESVDRERLITTNCYTRSDRLYHPSDMFLCAAASTLRKYYALPYQRKTHMDCVLRVCAEQRRSPKAFLSGAPEELLFRNYLEAMGWRFAETSQDSLQALRKYCYVANSWDVGLTWSKSRTPYRRPNSVILPYRFRMTPFAGGPNERARCWARHQIQQTMPSLSDLYHLCLSYGLWKFASSRRMQPEYYKQRWQKLQRSIAKRLKPAKKSLAG